MTTLYHQVRFPENQALIPDSYYFCPAKTCSIAYFSNAGNIIPKLHLRSYQAIQNDALCYCFDIAAEQYLEPAQKVLMAAKSIGFGVSY